MKRLLTVMMTLLLCMPLTGCVVSREKEDDIYIFYTSDVHCGVDENLGFSGLKAEIDAVREEHPYVSLIDLGDYLQGGTLGTLSKGSDVIELMSDMGYDLVTFGNHEFDYGMDRLKELMSMAKFGFVACNVKYSGSGTSVFENVPAYEIRQYGKIKVAFIGVLTPESITSSTPAHFMENGELVYDFCSGNDGMNLAEQVQKTVDEARQEGAQYVVVMAHLGSISSCVPYDSISLISHTSGIDVVLDGHSHSEIIGDLYPNKDGEDVILSSVGTRMKNAGELIIGLDGSITTLLISQTDKTDEVMQAAMDSVFQSQQSLLQEKVTSSDFDLRITDDNGIRMVRSRETNLADLVCDAYREVLKTDVVLVNGGSVRSNIPAGDITYEDLLNVNPFMNSLSSCYATGQQILDVLEFGARFTEKAYGFEGNTVGESGGFMQVSGLKYTIDTSIKSPVKVDDNGLFKEISGKRRVSKVYILKDGKYEPLDPKATYTVGSSDYVISKGGDGNTILSGCEMIIKAGPTDVEVLRQYLEVMDKVPEQYQKTQGRIKIK